MRLLGFGDAERRLRDQLDGGREQRLDLAPLAAAEDGTVARSRWGNFSARGFRCGRPGGAAGSCCPRHRARQSGCSRRKRTGCPSAPRVPRARGGDAMRRQIRQFGRAERATTRTPRAPRRTARARHRARTHRHARSARNRAGSPWRGRAPSAPLQHRSRRRSPRCARSASSSSRCRRRSRARGGRRAAAGYGCAARRGRPGARAWRRSIRTRRRGGGSTRGAQLSPRALRWWAISSRMPRSASASSSSSCARPKVSPSAVPCTSTKLPAPVITTFMSQPQAESSL